MMDIPRRTFMMHSHQCCTQEPFNHKREVEPGFGQVTHFCWNVPHCEWHLTHVPVHFLMDPHSVTNKQEICGFFFLSHAGPTHISKTQSNSTLKAQTIFIYTMTFPVLAKFQLTAFDLRNKMHRALTMLLELCNWPINYIFKDYNLVNGQQTWWSHQTKCAAGATSFLLEFDSFTKLFFYSKQLSCFLCP